MPNDPSLYFLNILMWIISLYPLIIVLAIAGFVLRLVIAVVVARKIAEQFQVRLENAIRQTPSAGSFPSPEWLNDVKIISQAWPQQHKLIEARYANRKADMMTMFNAARVPLPPGF